MSTHRLDCLGKSCVTLSLPLPGCPLGGERGWSAVWLALLLVCGSAQAAERFQFADAKHKQGELQHIRGIPVLTAQGTPDQMGEQIGTLLTGALGNLTARQDTILRGFGLQQPPAILFKVGALMLGQFPENQRMELKALAAASGSSFDLLVFGNVMYDYAKPSACSALLVEPNRSATGGVLFGRNLDFNTWGFLDQFSLVIVYRPEGKHAFASVNIPGLLGCVSGTNDAGLSLAMLEVNSSNDGTARFDPTGVPLAMCFRRVLEECATLDEAEKLLGSIKRTSMCNLAICDARDVAVLEITTKSIVRRPATEGLCACTNHFRNKELAVDMTCRRFETLEKSWRMPKLGLAEVAAQLHAVNQGDRTIQTMIFEPAAQTLHLSIGAGPASARQLMALDLAPLYQRDAMSK